MHKARWALQKLFGANWMLNPQPVLCLYTVVTHPKFYLGTWLLVESDKGSQSSVNRWTLEKRSHQIEPFYGCQKWTRVPSITQVNGHKFNTFVSRDHFEIEWQDREYGLIISQRASDSQMSWSLRDNKPFGEARGSLRKLYTIFIYRMKL